MADAPIPTKPFWKSTTLWINFVGILIVVLQLIVNTNVLPDKEVVTIILAVINILNRFRTTTTPQKLTLN